MCWIFLTFSLFSCIFTAQVPDDEQFVPDFQSDSRKYLISIVLKAASLYVSPVTAFFHILIWCFSPAWFWAEIQVAEAIEAENQAMF